MGCSTKHTQLERINPEDSEALINKISLNMSKEKVEELLGKPYSIEEKFSKDPSFLGVEITASYSPKLRYLEQQTAKNMRENQNIKTSKSILGGIFSIVSSVIPGTGIATTVGNSAVGVAGDLASNPLDPNSMDPNKIESAVVVYRENKVISITKRNLSSAPR